MESIPIVDLARILANDDISSETWRSVSYEIGKALKEIGFVYLLNHGIPSKSVDRAFTESKKFLELPSEIKLKYTKNVGQEGIQSFHGYAPPSKEILNKYATHELRESYDVKPECSIFPDDNLGSALTTLENQCRPLIKKLLRVLATFLKLDNLDFFVSATKSLDDVRVGSFNAFRSNYYPALPPNADLKDGTVRCSEHTDWGTFTLLFQDSVGGLEVKTADSAWVMATLIPGSILLNTGDMLEIWSNSVFPATPHRVLIHEGEVKRRLARQSMVYFVFPDNDTPISPLGIHVDRLDEQTRTAFQFAQARMDRAYKY